MVTTGGNTGKGKLVTDGNGKPQTGVGKKGLLRKTASHRLPLTEGNGKKREADVSRKATDDGGQKNNGKFTNGKSEKKITEKILWKTIPAATSTRYSLAAQHTPQHVGHNHTLRWGMAAP